MQVIITGMKRQVLDDSQSVSSRVEELPSEGIDFFDDDSESWFKCNRKLILWYYIILKLMSEPAIDRENSREEEGDGT